MKPIDEIKKHQVWIQCEQVVGAVIVDIDGYDMTKIESVWSAVVQFVEWYNDNK